jgi:uncharacterized protein YjbI with pentapeptide repeats
MAKPQHVERLSDGVGKWNRWRRRYPRVRPDLRGADLSGQTFCGYNFAGARLDEANLDTCNLAGANLTFAYLHKASLSCTDFRRANLSSADLSAACLVNSSFREANLQDAVLLDADMTGVRMEYAKLQRANLSGAKLVHSRLSSADLSGASLRYASIVDADFEHAKLNGCFVYGISAWNVDLNGCEQRGLVVGDRVSVDHLEIAQLVNLLLRSSSIRSVIDELSSKLVLILGRFTPERRLILDAIADVVRAAELVPVIVDFPRPKGRDITEAVSTLAHLAKFVIADITEARSVPQELSSIVPALPSVPVLPLLSEGHSEYGMFEHFKRYPSVMAVYRYKGVIQLQRDLPRKFIEVNHRIALIHNSRHSAE